MITYNVALEIASHEAVIRQAYKDSVGVWTWSVGITSASGHKVERYIDNPQTIDYCLEVYVWLLRARYLPAVNRAFKGRTLSEAQLAAALSFHWNTGAIERAQWVQDYRLGHTVSARKNFMNYNKPPEITERRAKERDLFFDGKWSNDGTMTEYTELTSRHTPKWRSGRKIDVKAVLTKIISKGE